MTGAMNVLSETATAGYLKMLKANLTRDTFVVLKEDTEIEDGLFHRCDSLSSYFRQFADGGFVHEDDVTDFRSYTDMTYLRAFFREQHGKNIHWLSYRRKTPGGYRWAVLEIQSAEDYTDDNAAVCVLVKDIQAAVSGQTHNINSVFRALCGSYDSIYCMDLECESLIPYRTFNHNSTTFDDFLQTSPSYRSLISRYIATSVLPEDRSHVARITEQNFIRDYLTLHNSYSSEYRTVYDGNVHWYRIQYSRIEPEGELRYVAIALSDISDAKRMELDFYRNSKAVLIVSGQNRNSDQLYDILHEQYPLMTAASGAEALKTLEKQHENVAVVLAEQHLPDMTGSELIHRIKAEHSSRSIPVIITDDNRGNGEEYIHAGAADFIIRPYQPAVVMNRVGFMIRYRESANMLNLLERDPLTGLFSKEFFFQSSEKIIHDHLDASYALLLSDVEHFHFYKERNGQETADELLRAIASSIPERLSGFVAGGRLSEDVFAFLIRQSPALPDEIQEIQQGLVAVSSQISSTSVSVKFGLYMVEEDVPASTMCDRAVMAVKSIKGVYGKNYAEYDLALKQQMLRTQQIVENAEGGLDGDQFLVYYQPKHEIKSGGVDGAEAVIRWQHPIMGFLNPVSFIPVFERNGFIQVLDRYVLHRVCSDLKQWQNAGMPVMPISVNISRVDFDRDTLADEIIRIVDSYGLDHSMIHIEITESGYADDPDAVTREAFKLHNAGFLIELDDFGTGYSSLSALSALPVDILKLDMSLLRQEDTTSNKSILEFSMKLAKIMNLKTVQEGVETKDQLERVASLGCNQVQGYFFSKPLPKDKFEVYCRDRMYTT